MVPDNDALKWLTGPLTASSADVHKSIMKAVAPQHGCDEAKTIVAL
jgi:hypothetical protein